MINLWLLIGREGEYNLSWKYKYIHVLFLAYNIILEKFLRKACTKKGEKRVLCSCSLLVIRPKYTSSTGTYVGLKPWSQSVSLYTALQITVIYWIIVYSYWVLTFNILLSVFLKRDVNIWEILLRYLFLGWLEEIFLWIHTVLNLFDHVPGFFSKNKDKRAEGLFGKVQTT